MIRQGIPLLGALLRELIPRSSRFSEFTPRRAGYVTIAATPSFAHADHPSPTSQSRFINPGSSSPRSALASHGLNSPPRHHRQPTLYLQRSDRPPRPSHALRYVYLLLRRRRDLTNSRRPTDHRERLTAQEAMQHVYFGTLTNLGRRKERAGADSLEPEQMAFAELMRRGSRRRLWPPNRMGRVSRIYRFSLEIIVTLSYFLQRRRPPTLPERTVKSRSLCWTVEYLRRVVM